MLIILGTDFIKALHCFLSFHATDQQQVQQVLLALCCSLQMTRVLAVELSTHWDGKARLTLRSAMLTYTEKLSSLINLNVQYIRSLHLVFMVVHSYFV